MSDARDRLAEMDGYIIRDGVPRHPLSGDIRPLNLLYPLTLDAAAAALPEGWVWMKLSKAESAAAYRYVGCLRSDWGKRHRKEISVPDTGNEIADRYKLALKAREATAETRDCDCGKHEHGRHHSACPAAAKKEPEPLGEQVMPRVDGKPFRCDCQCNVFAAIGPLRYRCNSCGVEYQGEAKKEP